MAIAQISGSLYKNLETFCHAGTELWLKTQVQKIQGHSSTSSSRSLCLLVLNKHKKYMYFIARIKQNHITCGIDDIPRSSGSSMFSVTPITKIWMPSMRACSASGMVRSESYVDLPSTDQEYSLRR